MQNNRETTSETSSMSYPWIADLGDGNYKNPVLHADYSDPDVIRHGDDFWMVASSFNCTPGLPILHSRDLVNWELVNHAIQQVPHPRYAEVQPGCGVWAPSIRFHAGLFWVFFPMPDEGIYVTNTSDPRGNWAEPWLLQEAKGWIDPCPFWDDDGQAYLAHAYANSRSGKKERIHIRPMSPDCRTLLSEGMEVFHTPHHLYLEGPKLHKLNGWYYILAPGGGVQTGWQVAFRSRSIWGPYEEKVILEQGSTDINGPHQGALIDLENGDWWFMHFQDKGAFGRVVHLQPVHWENDWPLAGVDHDGNGVGEPVFTWKKPAAGADSPVRVPETSDEFFSNRLGLQWQWHANHQTDWASLSARPDWLRLMSRPLQNSDLGRLPNFLGQKFPALGFTVETLLDFANGSPGDIAGLAVLGGNGHAAIAIRKTEDGNELVFIKNGELESFGPCTSAQIRLKIQVSSIGICRFLSATPSDAFAALARTFQATEGGWIGAKVGLFSASPSGVVTGSADFDYFRFS